MLHFQVSFFAITSRSLSLPSLPGLFLCHHDREPRAPVLTIASYELFFNDEPECYTSRSLSLPSRSRASASFHHSSLAAAAASVLSRDCTSFLVIARHHLLFANLLSHGFTSVLLSRDVSSCAVVPSFRPFLSHERRQFFCRSRSVTSRARATSSFLLMNQNVTLPGLFLCHHDHEPRATSSFLPVTYITSAQRIKSLTNSPSLPGSSGILQVGSESFMVFEYRFDSEVSLL